MPGWDLIVWTVAGLLIAAGVWWVDRSIRAAWSARGLSQACCPLCAYSLAGLETPACPECGLDLDEPDAGSRVRMAIGRARPGALLLMLGAMCAAGPTAVRDGPLALVPTTGLVLAVPFAPGDAQPLHDELRERVNAGLLSSWQSELLAARCLRVIQSNASERRRHGAAGLLADTQDRSAATAQAVAAALTHEDEEVRAALLPIGAELARKHEVVRQRLLEMVTSDASDRLRWRAIDALRQSGGLKRAPMSVLLAAAKDRSPRVRQRVAYAMLHLPREWTRAIELLRGAMHDPDESVREAALTVLLEIARRDGGAVGAG